MHPREDVTSAIRAISRIDHAPVVTANHERVLDRRFEFLVDVCIDRFAVPSLRIMQGDDSGQRLTADREICKSVSLKLPALRPTYGCASVAVACW